MIRFGLLVFLVFIGCKSDFKKKNTSSNAYETNQITEEEEPWREKCECLTKAYWPTLLRNRALAEFDIKFDTLVLKRSGYRHIEVVSDVFGLQKSIILDSNGVKKKAELTGKSFGGWRPKSTIVYTRTKKIYPDPLDSTKLRSDFRQWPRSMDYSIDNDGWESKSYADSTLVYFEKAKVSPNCDSVRIEHALEPLLTFKSDGKSYQGLKLKYSELFIYDCKQLLEYSIQIEDSAVDYIDHPEFLSEKYTYSSEGLLEQIDRVIIKNGIEHIDTIHYNYAKKIPRNKNEITMQDILERSK